MTVDVHETAEAAALSVAARLGDALRQRPAITLGLPTGRTPIAVYARVRAAGLDWREARTFNLDEFVGLDPTAPGSFRAFMDRHLFGGVALPPARIGFLRGDAADLDAECARYDAAMDAAGGLDWLLLGLGANGHIGFNEPGPTLLAPTHVVDLHESTRRANAEAFGGDWRRVPPRALTVGMGPVLRARRIVLMALGATKAEAVAAMIDGPLTTACPASWLQTHGDATVVLDRAAAARLRPPVWR